MNYIINFTKNFFKDKEGRIVLIQTPNFPLIAWFIFTIFSFLTINMQPKIHSFFDLLSFGFIFTWAWLEITSGVNNFRRTLGWLVLIIVMWLRLI